jgi:hypothetical protein
MRYDIAVFTEIFFLPQSSHYPPLKSINCAWSWIALRSAHELPSSAYVADLVRLSSSPVLLPLSCNYIRVAVRRHSIGSEAAGKLHPRCVPRRKDLHGSHHGRRRYRTPGRREDDGPNRLGRKGDAARRDRRRRARTSPVNNPGAMPWLLGGAARVYHRRVLGGGGRPDAGGASGGGTGADGRRGRSAGVGGEEAAAEGTPAR